MSMKLNFLIDFFYDKFCWYCFFTFSAFLVVPPGPVLSRRHGGDIVFWVCMHSLTHEGAIHVDGVVTIQKTRVTALSQRMKIS